LGGISGDDPYFTAAQTYFRTVGCPGSGVGDSPALIDLRLIFESPLFSSGGNYSPLGSKTSTLAATFPGNIVVSIPYPSNQSAAQDAYDNMGVRTLTIGNMRDRLWNPPYCGLGNTQFVFTQWVSDGTYSTPEIYARYFDSGGDNCFLDGALSQANHLLVLTDTNVMKAVKQFLSHQIPTALPIVGGES
jgi:hypothetical protein